MISLCTVDFFLHYHSTQRICLSASFVHFSFTNRNHLRFNVYFISESLQAHASPAYFLDTSTSSLALFSRYSKIYFSMPSYCNLVSSYMRLMSFICALSSFASFRTSNKLPFYFQIQSTTSEQTKKDGPASPVPPCKSSAKRLH